MKAHWIRFATVLATVTATGHGAVGPDYSGPPTTTAPMHYKNAQNGSWKVAQPSDLADRGRWWEVFHDSTLNKLEAAAVNSNQDLQLAIDRIQEATADVRVAAADFYPNINIQPNGNRQRTSNTEPFQQGELLGNNPFGGPGVGATGGAASNQPLVIDTQPLSRTYNTFRFPANLSWELDLFGRVKRNKEAAKATLQANAVDLQNTLLVVTAAVASDYYSLRSLDAEVGVLERTIKTRKDAVEIAQERLEAGLTGQLDVARARADLAGNEASLFAVKRSRGEVENAIATLVGQPASNFKIISRELDGPVPRIPTGLPSQLLERRPDVAVAERQLAAASARIGVAMAAFFPEIRLTGAAGFESADLGTIFNWESRIWQIGPSITLPIFEGGRNRANLKISQAQFNERVDQYRKQVLVAFQDVETALEDLHTLADEAEAQDRAVQAGKQALELSQQQYSKGRVNFLDVLDAERTLLSDERTSAQLLGQRLQATVQLIKALGGSWK